MRNIVLLAITAVALYLLPELLTFSQREVLVFLTFNVLVVASYRVMTLTGEWSLGHVVIMGVGAYTSALLTKDFGLWVPFGVIAGGLAAAFVALLLSYPLFRMKGFYFLIGSFAAGEIIRLLWKWSELRNVFGGAKGIKGIPPMPNFSIGFYDFDFFEPTSYFYMSAIVVAICLLILWRIEKSPVGLTFQAVHWQDTLAQASGVNIRGYKTLAFVIASGFAGIGGALLAHYIGTVNPNSFNLDVMVFVLTWAIVGGTSTFYGPIIGCVVLTVINEVVLRQLGLDEARPLFYGVILILSILFMPKGLEGLVQKILPRNAGQELAGSVRGLTQREEAQ